MSAPSSSSNHPAPSPLSGFDPLNGGPVVNPARQEETLVGVQLSGLKGTYQVDRWLYQRGQGAVYSGRHIETGATVTLREYPLTTELSTEVLKDRCASLVKAVQGPTVSEAASDETAKAMLSGEPPVGAPIAGMPSLAETYRLILPQDMVIRSSARTAYRVASPQDGNPSLRQILQERGPLPAADVRQVLDQVLQSLECLHYQTWPGYNPPGQTGLTHGNLSLDSLLWRQVDDQFFIYLSDFAQESTLLKAADSPPTFGTVAKDLADLGTVAQSLLTGAESPAALRPEAASEIQAASQAAAAAATRLGTDGPADLPLIAYLRRLTALSTPFDSAAAARRALHTLLPPDRPVTPRFAVPADSQPRGIAPWAWGGLGVALLAGILWAVWPRTDRTVLPPPEPRECCFNAVNAVPTGQFVYTGVEGGGWQSLVQSGQSSTGPSPAPLPSANGEAAPEGVAPADPSAPTADATPGNTANNDPANNDFSNNNTSNSSSGAADAAPDSGETASPETTAPGESPSPATSANQPPQLHRQLFASQPGLQLAFRPTASPEAALAAVEARQVAFAILPLPPTPLPNDLTADIIAYDGLAVVVANQGAGGKQPLPQALRGHLSLEQLRQLYRGDVTNWQKVGGTDLPVRLYAPANQEMLSVFKQTLFPELGPQESVNPDDAVTLLPPTGMEQAIVADATNEGVGGIGFNRLQNILDQCTVYPLALKAEDGKPVQPVRLSSAEPITPNTRLCDQTEALTLSQASLITATYPLAYPVAVIYAQDNSLPPVGRKFAELMQTVEGQRLLKEAGLTPIATNLLTP